MGFLETFQGFGVDTRTIYGYKQTGCELRHKPTPYLLIIVPSLHSQWKLPGVLVHFAFESH